MPFDQKIYDGIFRYALFHLLDEKGRAKLIRDCYHQLRLDGYMVFIAPSKNTATYREGIELSSDRSETKHGINLFFYNPNSVEREFDSCGLVEAEEINVPAETMENKPSQKFWRIICRKEAKD